jgi:hypothetical protein
MPSDMAGGMSAENMLEVDEKSPSVRLTNDVSPQNLNGSERNRRADGDSEKHHEDLGGIARQEVQNELFDVVVDPSTFLHGIRNSLEIIISKDNAC